MFYLTLIDDETDRQMFLRLYNEHRDEMFFYAERILGDRMLAEDALQEAFIKIARSMGRLDFSKSPRALLLTVVRNTALSIKGKSLKEEALSDLDSFPDDKSSGLENSVHTRINAQRIADIVDGMSDIYSDVFRLRYGHDMTFAQISAVLGISVQTAKKRAQRARDEIRKQLKGEI